MDSVWTNTVNIPSKQWERQDFRTEVLIIGGGMAGILCAYKLQQVGVPYVLVEASTICSGITKNTTAKITSQHGLIYDKLLHEFGVGGARMYLDANEKALEEYRKLCSKIECDFEEKVSAVYSLNRRDKIEKEVSALEKIGFSAMFKQRLPLPFEIAGAVQFPNQAQFHPLKFIAAIVPELQIYEHTKVLEIKEDSVVTNWGSIKAKKIIVATHFPFLNKHGSYFLKQYQHRSYVIAYEHAPSVDGMFVDESKKGLSFRNYKNLLLIGGGGGRTGKKCGNWQEISEFADKYYPDVKEKYRWATQDCMTLDGVPYIGQYSKNTPDFYVATGFNKWGMTSSMVAANILTDCILGKENPYTQIFSPSRSMMKPQLLVNGFEATVNLLMPTAKRCPHMGCALKWNAQEQSWDCSCHGSRFTEEGEVIDNPATDDLNMP